MQIINNCPLLVAYLFLKTEYTYPTSQPKPGLEQNPLQMNTFLLETIKSKGILPLQGSSD